MKKCPLCGSEKIIWLKDYDTAQIIDTYRDGFGVDVRRYFSSEKMPLHQCGKCGLQFFPDGVEGESEFYEGMSRQPWYYMKDKFEYGYTLQKIVATKPDSILEIGCGKGYFLEHLQEGYKVCGTEHNEEAMAELQQKGIALDDDQTSYDFIAMFQVMEHVKDLRPFMEWVVGKLNPQGYLCIAVPNPDSAYLQEFAQITDLPPHHMNRISRDTFYAMAELLGLVVEDYFTEPICDIHLQQLIAERQKLFRWTKDAHLSEEIVQSVQTAILPLVRELLPFRGHTHGVLLKRA